MAREHGQVVAATTEVPEIQDGVELVQLHGIPDGWGRVEGDGLQVNLPDGRLATFLGHGPEHSDIFSWSVDPSFTHLARLMTVSGTVLRVTLLDRMPKG
jgi:hypothetical protein